MFPVIGRYVLVLPLQCFRAYLSVTSGQFNYSDHQGAGAIFRRLGSSRDRVYELSVSDPVKVVFIGAELDVEQGVA